MHTSIAALTFLVLVPPVSTAQDMQRPPIPAQGLQIREEPSQHVSYSDGQSALGCMIVPDHPVPAQGWPVVVRIHSLGANRTQALAWRRELASQGYAVWAYDVRGHASAKSAAQTMWRGQELFDMAEQLAFVRTAWRGVVDAKRIAVIGRSQGGVHAWAAAANSERRIEVRGRGVRVMPRISAVIAGDFVADPAEQRLRDGTAFSSFSVEVAAPGAPTLFSLDPSYRQAFRRAFLAQTPEQLAENLYGTDDHSVSQNLAKSRVPIMYFHAYRDLLCGPQLGLRALRRLPETTPWRVLLTTVGHGTPANSYEDALRRKQSVRWLACFLWLEDSRVLEEAQVIRARVPLDNQRTSTSYLMGHEFVRLVGKSQYRDITMSLACDGPSLGDSSSPKSGATLVQTVASHYTPQSYFDNPFMRQTAVLLAAIPLAEKVYRFPATVEALQLGEEARVHLELTPDGRRFSVAVVLSAILPGQTKPVMLASSGQTVLDAVPDERTQVDLDLLPVACALPTGTVLELSVRNLWLRESPMQRRVEVAPLFVDFALRIHGEGNASLGFSGSTLSLPVRRPEPVLVSSVLEVDASEPRRIPLQVRAGKERSGATYTILAGLSGHGELGAPAPLRFDALTHAVLQMSNAPALPGFIGVLDRSGEAEAAFDLGLLPPLPSLLVGRELTLAVCVLGRGGRGEQHWSSPLDVMLR